MHVALDAPTLCAWPLCAMGMWQEVGTCLTSCQVSLLAMAKTRNPLQIAWLLTSSWTSTTIRSQPSTSTYPPINPHL